MRSKEYTLNVRVPPDLFEEMGRLSEQLHTSKSEVARDFILRCMHGENTEEHVFFARVEWSKAVKKRDKGTCQDCGAIGEEAHHVRPVTQGGVNALSNGVFLCKKCHRARHKDRVKDPAHDLIPVGYKLPQWLVDWIRSRPEPAALLIKEALTHQHDIPIP